MGIIPRGIFLFTWRYMDFDKVGRILQASNVNVVSLQTKSGGRGGVVFFPSATAPRGWDGYPDLVQEAAKTLPKYGVKVRVHIATFVDPWKANEYPSRVAVMRNGKRAFPGEGFERGYPTMCPARPEHKDYLASLVKEVMTKYPVDGIDLDYIRFAYKAPDSYTCYCSYCRDKFEEETRLNPLEIKEDSPEWEKWIDWRAGQITQFVGRAAEVVHSTRPGATLGAYIASWWSDSSNRAEVQRIRERFGQDVWKLSGVLDMFAPMLYHRYVDDPDLKIDQRANWVASLTRWIVEAAKPKPVWTTVQAVRDDPDETRMALEEAFNGGAHGVYTFGLRLEDEKNLAEMARIYTRLAEIEASQG